MIVGKTVLFHQRYLTCEIYSKEICKMDVGKLEVFKVNFL